MFYRKLGNTGMTVSVVGIGTWQFGGEWGKQFEPKEVSEMFEAGRRLGINLVDTAECYGDHTSESLVGQAIEKDRDKWVVATKFGHKFHGFKDRTTDFSAKGMLEQLEGSLKALRTDWIDVYQFHGVTEEVFEDHELWSEVERQKGLGKIRAIGVSIGHDPMPLGRLVIDVAQLKYNRLERKDEEEILPICRQRDLGVFARVPLASGYLTDKYKPGQRWPEGDVRHDRKDEAIDHGLEVVDRIRKEEVPKGVPMAQWALAWILKNPAVTAVIPGCKTVAQVESNASAVKLDIAQDGHPQATTLD
jgi:aryl-alcohol dehydrogenase-like predicted oxidoreductase